ncbi:hypothetical protein [Thorsellia kenyensis]|uniref:Uncharacterized protein n=1 Tax=Thorsellia kenyensis TaxID=1549888 RepID=A0ABV6CAE2_9GAMM
MGISQASYRYTVKLSYENVQVAEELLQLIDEHKLWGFKFRFDYLGNVKGRP